MKAGNEMDIDWNSRQYLYYITKMTKQHNIDNISRTKAYQNLFFQFPEMKWALVASFVSRNAGWNMTDLHLAPFQQLLSEKERRRLFMTYERANWLIFADAYPQLLLYKISIEQNKPLFNLLRFFHVSKYMKKEWEIFWMQNDSERLMTALIINEQNIIQSPVIQQSFFRKQVFFRLPYILQNIFSMNAVLLPTLSGKIYGKYVNNFRSLTKRVELGKEIANIIFHKDIYNDLIQFAIQIEPTGSRNDYEPLFNISLPKSPALRLIYPKITHSNHKHKDWYSLRKTKPKWKKPISVTENREIGLSFYKKRQLLYSYYHLKNIFT